MYWNFSPSPHSCLILMWLIETWDVLKCTQLEYGLEIKRRLIETWDVLKCKSSATGNCHSID